MHTLVATGNPANLEKEEGRQEIRGNQMHLETM